MIGKIYTLGDVATYINGRAFKPAEWETTGLPIVRIQNLTDRTAPCNRSTNKFEDKFLLKDGDLLFAWAASLGVHIWQGGPAWLNQHIFKVIPNEGIEKKYLYFYLLYTISDLYRKAHGSGMVHITKGPFLATKIPLPSLTEQQRIVAKIEELFSELDNSVAALKQIKAQLSVYRQAVLKDAFSNITSTKSIQQSSVLVTSGSRGWAQYYSSEGARFVRITDLTRDSISLKDNNIQHVNIPQNAEGTRSKLLSQDILVSITADLGSIALIPDNIGDAFINQHIALVRLKNSKLAKCIAWYLRSDLGQKSLLKNKRGGGKLGLGLDDIRCTDIPDISEKESTNILRYIESRLSTCDNVEKTINAALQQAESLRQSILKQEFKKLT